MPVCNQVLCRFENTYEWF